MKKLFAVLILFLMLTSLVVAQQLFAMAKEPPDTEKTGFSNAELDNRAFVSSIPAEEDTSGNIPEPADGEGTGYYDEDGIFHNY